QIAGDSHTSIVSQQIVRCAAVDRSYGKPIPDSPDQLSPPAARVNVGQAGEVEVDSLAGRYLERSANRTVGQNPQPAQHHDRQADREENQARKYGPSRRNGYLPSSKR